MNGKLCFVILTWNSAMYIRACLDAILALPFPEDILIYVTDNGSSDETQDILRAYESLHKDRFFATFEKTNRGTTLPRNCMMREVPPDTKWICVLDSDTEVNPLAVDRLITALIDHPNAMLASPRMWKRNGEEQMSCKRFPTAGGKLMKAAPVRSWQRRAADKESYSFFPAKITSGNPPVAEDTAVYPADYAISACWMLRADVRDRVGYLDEFYRYAPEDVDYCAAIWENGYDILFVSGASIFHDTQRLSHKKKISATNWAHIRGLIHYFRKYAYLNHPRIRKDIPG